MDIEFSEEKLNDIFMHDDSNCLTSPESYIIEYKQSFNINFELFKTMNGLANNKGGYIICGVEPTTKKLIGLSEEKIKFYHEKADSEELRGKIFSSCQPNIEYKQILYNYENLSFVIFYIPESLNKPHIFNNSSDGEIKQGDIFYRYNDSIKKIQYAELNAIIENKRIQEQEKWMTFLGKIAKIGLDDVYIINGKNGEVFSAEEDKNQIMLDDGFLSKLKIIKEGHFDEINGDPAVKIIGEFKQDSNSVHFKLTTDTTAVFNPSDIYPYGFNDLLKELEKNKIKTKDGIVISRDWLHYIRIKYFIINNKLDVGDDYYYESKNYEGAVTKRFSRQVYNIIKEKFETLTQNEIKSIKLIDQAEENTIN